VNRKHPTPSPNRPSYLKHRRETNLQILLPIILTSLLTVALFALIVYATFAQDGQVEQWAAVSTIWIVLPLLLVLLVMFALVAGMVYGMHRLLKIAPDYTGLAQAYVQMITAKINHYNNEFTNRVVRFRAWVDTAQGFVRRK
jgi:energy-coupling factor transporter transmembrane protein EcfT